MLEAECWIWCWRLHLLDKVQAVHKARLVELDVLVQVQAVLEARLLMVEVLGV